MCVQSFRFIDDCCLCFVLSRLIRFYLYSVRSAVTHVFLDCFLPAVRIPSGLPSKSSNNRITDDSSSSRISSTASSIFVQIELGVYDQFTVVQSPTSLCQLNVVQMSSIHDSSTSESTSDADYTDPRECPHAGMYQWTAVYTVPSFPDPTLHYTPDVRLTFLNEFGQRVGCVVCGPLALRAASDARAVHGLVALGISLTVFIGVFSILLYLSHRRKQGLERVRAHGGGSGGAPHPFKKNNSTSTSMQYQYFRTLPNGQVVPVVGHPPRPRQQQSSQPPTSKFQKQQQLPRLAQMNKINSEDEEDGDDDSDDARNISNPAYNETQLPSRPII